MDRKAEVRHRWQQVAKVIERETGHRVARLTAEQRRATPEDQPAMFLVAVEFADGAHERRPGFEDGLGCEGLMRVSEIRQAVEALAPTLRLRRGALSSRRYWIVEREPPGRRSAFRELIE